MSARPSLLRSIPFWILLIGSLATSAFGAWLAVSTLQTMATALTAQTATPVDVYVGQVWAIVGGILIATGIVGVALALVVAAVRSFVPATEVAVVEPIDWSSNEETAVDEPVRQPVAETAAPSSTPVAESAPAEPASVEPSAPKN